MPAFLVGAVICCQPHMVCYYCMLFFANLVNGVLIVHGMKYLFIALISISVLNYKSQNLIVNGSFENYTNIDCLYGAFYNMTTPYPYTLVVDDWGIYQSPDYFNSVCTNTYTGAPENIFGYSYSKNGNAHAGIIVFHRQGETKEYVYQHLNAPLIAGKVYCLSFFVSRADRNQYAIKNIGAYFSNSLPPLVAYQHIQATPQVENQSGFIADTTLWSQIQGCFIANGGEQYMTIGNFNYNANTDTLFVGTNHPDPNYPGSQYYYSYYYIDDITLIEQSTVGVNKIGEDDDFKIFPNPTTGLISFSDDRFANGEYNVRLLDIFGKEVMNDFVDEEIDITFLDKGVYTLLLYKNKQLVVTKKVMKD
jgi:hypothetical protein